MSHENKVYNTNCIEGLKQLPEKCANLIICDPPYFRVKGDFDFKMTWAEWLQLHEDLARECRRVIADNGSLFLYGHASKIAYQQMIFDKWFRLENNITWWVHDRQTNKGIDSFRKFAPVTERLLFYSTGMEPGEWDQTGWERVKLDVANFKPLRDYSERLQKSIGLGIKAINEKMGHRKAEHFFYWNSTQYDLCTPETYAQLIEVFNIDKWPGFREYEDLRREYEDLRRPFNNFMRLTDVMRFSQEGHRTGNYDHETVKPEKLTRALILTCSRPGDLVVVPFAGSGTECAMAAKERRRFIGFDTESKYVDMANERARPHLERKQISILDIVEQKRMSAGIQKSLFA